MRKALEAECFFLVKTSGFEPPTPCMSSRYSNQLSYAFIITTNGNMAEMVGFEPTEG